MIHNPDSHPLLPELLALEISVWDALKAGDRAQDRALLCPEFLGVYPSGFAGRDDHADQLGDGPSVVAYTLSEARVLPVGADHAMLSYLATYTRPGQSGPEAMYVSSLWRREGQEWRNLFSQDTPVSDHPVP
ncbi:DUF4440 domain-containing protein [Roseovarius sp. 2305UL8-3]|uniref:DUF4440 domain-containing protein n=1 Tax=Roseovarius conchicola TaxID=3121636 RepID=UPI003528199B